MSEPALPQRGPIRALLAEWIFEKKLPPGLGFLRALGTALLLVLVVQAVTGMLLALCYVPSPDHAYDSIRYIDEDVGRIDDQHSLGKIVRGMHHWGSSAILVLALLHMARVYFTGGYKRPRGGLWVIGVAIFGVLLAFGFTGYLLPWDMKAFWATDVGINIVATVPWIGPKIADLLRGGPELGAPTLTRMFAMHVLLLPALLVPLAGLHLLLVHKLGITPPGARVGEREPKTAPFFPDHLLRELAVGFAAIFVVLVMAWWLGPPLEAPADRDAKGYDPRPEWYFLGLFQLLKYFQGRNVIYVTTVIPAVVTLAVLLLPWLDRNHDRTWRRRPVAVGIGAVFLAAVVGLTAWGFTDRPKNNRPPPPRVPVGDGTYVPPSSPPFFPPKEKEKPAEPQPASPPKPPPTLTAAERKALLAEGEGLMREYECTTCHTYKGLGDDTGAGAPDFTKLDKGHDADWFDLYLLDPKKMKPDVDMPSAFDLGMKDADRKKLALWLHVLSAE